MQEGVEIFSLALGGTLGKELCKMTTSFCHEPSPAQGHCFAAVVSLAIQAVPCQQKITVGSFSIRSSVLRLSLCACEEAKEVFEEEVGFNAAS